MIGSILPNIDRSSVYQYDINYNCGWRARSQAYHPLSHFQYFSEIAILVDLENKKVVSPYCCDSSGR
ncbi:hypothetical protein RDI58_004096 [Solanum bulbocastanum]|uniref:Uncharacterized protein n=1 Tax=Solanum bulbocastanum TaxID=147425 RepID=A0AAN8TY98_SOLBU